MAGGSGGRPVFNIGLVLLPVPAFPGGNKMGGQGCFGKPDICLFINNNLLISIDCLFPVFYKEDGGGRVCDGHGKPLCIRYNPGYLCTFRGSYLGFYRAFYDLVCLCKQSFITFFSVGF